MTDDRLLDPAAPLVAFGQALGISADAWARDEDVERLTYFDEQIDPHRAAALPVDTLRSLAEAYGPALTCRFLLGELPVLDVAVDVDDAALTAFRGDTRSTGALTLDLALDKARLAEHRLGTVPGCRILLYLFPEALRSLVTGDIAQLEQALWGTAPTGKVVVLVPGADLRLDGPYLAVLGGQHVAEWRQVVPAAPPDFQTTAELYRLCRENVHWEAAWLRQLTPLHMKLDGDAAVDDPIAQALRVHLLNTVLLYAADRSDTGPSGRRQSTFNGARQRVTVPWGDPKTTLLSSHALARLPSLVGLVEWAYSPPWSGDRLRMVQLAVTDLLLTAEPAARAERLTTGAAAVQDGLEWHWKAFIKEKTGSYDAEVRAMEDDVAKVLKDFGEQTTEMIKSLSDTMLAAVAVVLASLVASLFSDKFNPKVLQITGLLYAAYVALFPLGFNMTNQHQRHRSLTDSFEARRKRFAERIPPERVAEIIGDQVSGAGKRYTRWFWVTVLAYAAVIALGILAAYEAPALGAMVQAGATSNVTPTATTPPPPTLTASPAASAQPQPALVIPTLTP